MSATFLPADSSSEEIAVVPKPIHCCYWTLLSLLFAVAAPGILSESVIAQEDLGTPSTVKPVAVLSVASVEHLTADLAYLTAAAGRADVAVGLQFLNSGFLQDFDRTRPAGVLITLDDIEPRGVGFLPVPDSDKLLDRLKQRFGFEIDDLGNGIKKICWGKGAYLKQQGEWLFFTDQAKHLAHLPADPVAMLDGLEQQYGLAARFYVSNIPQALKDVADYLIQSNIDRDFREALRSGSKQDEEFVGSMRDSLKKWSSTLINDSDQITVGWAVDLTSRRTYIDLQALARKDSSLSRQFHALTNSRSTFNGFFVDNAAFASQGSLRMTQAGQQQLSSFLDYVREKAIQGIEEDGNAPEPFKEIVNTVLDVIDRTVREGKTDIGATLLLAPSSFRFVGGARVVDGRALAGAFEQLFELAKDAPDVPDVHFYASRHRNLDLHRLALPISEHDIDARKLLGDHVDVTIATGDEQLYFAFGKGSDRLLIKIVDRSVELGEQPVAPLRIRVAFKSVVSFLASLEPENEQLQSWHRVMERTKGSDILELVVEQVDNGVGCRLQFEEGVMALLGEASRNQHGP